MLLFHVLSLEVVEQEDWTGSDSIYLLIESDALPEQWEYDLGKAGTGETIFPDVWIPYDSHCAFSVWEWDLLDPNDPVGSLIAPGEATVLTTKDFVYDNMFGAAKYRMTWEVVKQDETDPYACRFAAATLARAPIPTGVWINISAERFQNDLLSRLSDPSGMKQQMSWMCGPAAIGHALLTRRPDQFVKFVRELFLSGKLSGRTKLYVVPSETLTGTVPIDHADNDLNAADWVWFAGIRASTNSVMAITAAETSGVPWEGTWPPWAGIGYWTMPGDMVEWSSEILFMNSVRSVTTLTSGERKGLVSLEAITKAGGVGFIWCNPSIMRNTDPEGNNVQLFPDHWVVYVGAGDPELTGSPWTLDEADKILIEHRPFGQDDLYHFKVWSYGRFEMGQSDEDAFEDCFWGYVTAIGDGFPPC